MREGIHWRNAKSQRLRDLAMWSAYECYPEMVDAECEHDGTIEVIFGSQGACLTLRSLDAEATRLFTFGHCAILAWGIHEKTGLPLAVFTSQNTEKNGWSGHVAVQLSDGNLFDVQGITTAEEIASRYRTLDGTFRIVDDEEFKDLIVDAANRDNPENYLCELEQLVLADFVDFIVTSNTDVLQ
jgi:hypothetical protein